MSGGSVSGRICIPLTSRQRIFPGTTSQRTSKLYRDFGWYRLTGDGAWIPVSYDLVGALLSVWAKVVQIDLLQSRGKV